MTKYSLVGISSNAFTIMGYVRNAMANEGKTNAEIAAYTKNATSSDYNNLLVISSDMIDELNQKYATEDYGYDEDEFDEDSYDEEDW